MGAAGREVWVVGFEQLTGGLICVRELLAGWLGRRYLLRGPSARALVGRSLGRLILFPERRRFGPTGRKHFSRLLRRLGNVSCNRLLGLEGNKFDGWLRLGPRLGLRDQSFTESTLGWFRAIAAAFDGQVGPFSFARAITVSIAVSVSVSRPLAEFLDRGRIALGRAKRSVDGIWTRRAATGVAYAIAITLSARVASAFTLTWGRVGLYATGSRPFEILGFDIRDVQESVATDREVDESGLNCGLEIDDSSLVNVAGVALVTGTLDVQLFEYAVLNDGDPTFLGLFDVDQHFFLHAVSFRSFRRKSGGMSGVDVSSNNSPLARARLIPASWPDAAI
jgi:hypothetical protein